MADTGIRIRPMTAADVEIAASLAKAEWGDRRHYLRFYFSHPQCRLLAAEVGGAVVGTGSTTFNGATGWMGELFVSPEYRRSGVGSALFETRLRYLEERGCSTILLAATAMGRPIYERFGFQPEASMYYRLRGPLTAERPQDPRLRHFRPDDFEAVVEIDRRVTGEDRAHLIAALSEGAWVTTDQRGRVCGYLLPTPWPEGAVIAMDPGFAEALLERRMAVSNDGAAAVAVPAGNVAALRYFEARGFKRTEELIRMTRGIAVDWDPAKIWTCLNLALG